jgi:hypothetical protein
MSKLTSNDSIWRSITTERFLSRLRVADASYACNLQEPVRLNAYISYYSTILQDVDHIQQLRQEKLSMPVLVLGGDYGKGKQWASRCSNTQLICEASSSPTLDIGFLKNIQMR